MEPSTVAPIMGPLTIPSRIEKRPRRAGELDPHAREIDAGVLAAGRAGDHPIERRFAADREVRNIEKAVLRRDVGGYRVHRHPHLAAENLAVHVGEAEKGPCILGIDVDDLPAAVAAAQIAAERRVVPELGADRQALDGPAPPRQGEIEAAQGLAVETHDGADLDVEVDVPASCLPWVDGRTGHRRFDEISAIIDVAAHHHPQRAVGTALGLEHGLVAVRKVEGRETRRLNLATIVGFDRALDGRAGPVDHDVIKAGRGRPADDRKRRMRGLSARLGPSRQQIIDSRLGQIRVDRKPAFTAFECRDPAVDLDRHRPAHITGEIVAELAARRLIERALDANLGIAVAARLAVIE